MIKPLNVATTEKGRLKMRLIDADALKAKIRKSEQEIKRIRKEIVRDLKHWQYLREYGCQDPFWADGVNMNLTRNHIIYYKMRLRELCPDGNLPEEYFLPTPPEVDDNYLAPKGKYFKARKAGIEEAGSDNITTKTTPDINMQCGELF